MSYGVLDALSDHLASYLKEQFKVSVGDLIGICLDPTPNAIVCVGAIGRRLNPAPWYGA